MSAQAASIQRWNKSTSHTPTGRFLSPLFQLYFLRLRCRRGTRFLDNAIVISPFFQVPLNLSGYENSSCAFFPVGHSFCLLDWNVECGSDLMFLWIGFYHPPPPPCTFLQSEWTPSWITYMAPADNGLDLKNKKRKHGIRVQTALLLDFVSASAEEQEERASRTDEAWSLLIMYKVFKIQSWKCEPLGEREKKKAEWHGREFIFDRWHDSFWCNWFAFPFVSPFFSFAEQGRQLLW